MRAIVALILFAAAPAAQPQIQPINPSEFKLAGPQQLVAFMGDSWAAGEGAPNGSGHPQWDDQDCHRSELNGRYATAVALQAAAGTSLVPLVGQRANLDFIDVSCSGATISAGILGRYEGVFEMRPDGPRAKVHPNGLAPQVDQVQQWLNGRQLDTLVLSIGGNDAGFGRVVPDCMNPTISDCSQNAPTVNAMNQGASVMVNGHPVAGRLIGFDHLEAAFQALDAAIRQKLNPKHIILVNYPNPLGAGATICHDFDDGVAIYTSNADDPNAKYTNGWFGIGAATKNVTLAEANFMEVSFLNKINSVRAQFAANLQWDFIDVSAFSVNHGFCANQPWFNTPADSMPLQGDFNGTAHPNALGYIMFEKFLKRELAHTMNVHLTGGFRLNEETYFVSYPAPPPPPSANPTATSMNRPPIEVDPNTYQQASPEQKQYIEANASLNVIGLFYPMSDHVLELGIEVSTKSFEFNPAEQDIKRYTALLKPGPEGTYLIAAPLQSYASNTDLYIRWRVRYSLFWDPAEVRFEYSPQMRFVVKTSDAVAKKL